MPKNQHKTTDFVELVYNSNLLQFMGKVSCGILMEDGALVHHNKSSKECRKLRLLEKLDWPVNSSDFNSLENVWKLLKDVVQYCQKCSKNLEEIKMTSQRKWRSINSIKLCNLCHSMHAKLQTMIEANGRHTS